ncbi:hypothetical protein KW794_01710 [Candidatus Saccharibacteria bacterium]|nr:hypothetical protein [Candidatus Saccharibacteria bacterium]
MKFESLHKENQPILEGGMEIYGAKILQAAYGVEQGLNKSMIIYRESGVPEVIINSGGSALVKEVLSQFAIQTLIGRKPVEESNNQSADIVEKIDG